MGREWSKVVGIAGVALLAGSAFAPAYLLPGAALVGGALLVFGNPFAEPMSGRGARLRRVARPIGGVLLAYGVLCMPPVAVLLPHNVIMACRASTAAAVFAACAYALGGRLGPRRRRGGDPTP